MTKGTPASLADLIRFELDEQPGVPLADPERIRVLVELRREQRGRAFSDARSGEILDEGMGWPGSLNQN